MLAVQQIMQGPLEEIQEHTVGRTAQPIISETAQAPLASGIMDVKGMPTAVNARMSALPLFSPLLGCG